MPADNNRMHTERRWLGFLKWQINSRRRGGVAFSGPPAHRCPDRNALPSQWAIQTLEALHSTAQGRRLAAHPGTRYQSPRTLKGCRNGCGFASNEPDPHWHPRWRSMPSSGCPCPCDCGTLSECEVLFTSLTQGGGRRADLTLGCGVQPRCGWKNGVLLPRNLVHPHST